MNDFQAIADRVEIEALRAEFTDASMMYDWDRAYIAEFGRFHDGRSNLNYSLYHDRYQRTPRRLEVRRAVLRGQVRRQQPSARRGLEMT